MRTLEKYDIEAWDEPKHTVYGFENIFMENRKKMEFHNMRADRIKRKMRRRGQVRIN